MEFDSSIEDFMERERSVRIEFLHFRLLGKEKDLRHFITTRHGGVSSGSHESLNLSNKVSDAPGYVEENRKRIAAKLNIALDRMIFPGQCHSDKVNIIGTTWNQKELTGTDALITNEKDICLCILTADCVPILLFDREKKIVAAVHAGWRGTARRIVSRTIEKMIKEFLVRPEDLMAGIGPAISQSRYETGDEVASQFHFLFHDHPEVLWKNPNNGKIHIDLQQANRVLLLRAGLTEEHIEIKQICTFDHPDLFFSARRDGPNCGRFGTGIMLL
jgi:YfiH family protein